MAEQQYERRRTWSRRQHPGCVRLRWRRSASTSARKAHNWANNGKTQTPAHFCMFYGLGSATFPRETHKSNQAQLRSRQIGTHRRACREHETGKRVPRFQDGVAAGSRHCWQCAGAARQVFCSSRRVSTDTGRLGPLHSMTDLRRARLRQRNFKAHPQDTLLPEVWKNLARFLPGFLKTMDDATLADQKDTHCSDARVSVTDLAGQ